MFTIETDREIKLMVIEGGCLVGHAKSCPTLLTLAARLLCPWDFPGKNAGVGCHFQLQGIFLTQGSNPLAGRFFTTEPARKPQSG